MPPLALFGIEDGTVSTVVNLLVLFLAVLWLALVFWTYKDAVRRIADPLLVACSTATSLFFPFVGTVVYLILRPPEYLEDVRERELEIAAAEARLLQMHEDACPFCSYPVEKAFLRCPSCLKRLKEPCATCGKPLDPRWRICPYCEAEVGQEPRQRRRRARPADRARPAAPERQPASAAGGERAPGRTAARSGPVSAQGSAERPADERTLGSQGADGTERRAARPSRAPREPGAAPVDPPTVARPGS